jgi:hypothetical protein
LQEGSSERAIVEDDSSILVMSNLTKPIKVS